ncbi:MAG: class I SAM-dependent methyltransferase [Patescibacteria group bacterium]|jgi:23S rRNA (cytosine1962-C5)-methyltransferase
MDILSTRGWSDYELLDSGNEERLERFGKYTLLRPDPQCIWIPRLSQQDWEMADAEFYKESSERGSWKVKTEMPESWEVIYKDLKFKLKLSPFKHTGLFPEQHVQWDWMRGKVKSRRSKVESEVNILNLFAYTGGATLAAAAEGAKVTHVDASKSAISWARENQAMSGLSEKPVRWILDDAMKFVSREIKRGVRYDGIILDPPIYGHGPTGETWDLMRDLPKLLNLCQQVLSEHPLFVVVNAYAVSASSIMLENTLQTALRNQKGSTSCGELVLEESTGGRQLSTGIFGRWEAQS